MALYRPKHAKHLLFDFKKITGMQPTNTGYVYFFEDHSEAEVDSNFHDGYNPTVGDYYGFITHGDERDAVVQSALFVENFCDAEEAEASK